MASSVASWLPFARASAVGWVPLSTRQMPTPLPSLLAGSTVDKSNEKLTLNVSGRRRQPALELHATSSSEEEQRRLDRTVRDQFDEVAVHG